MIKYVIALIFLVNSLSSYAYWSCAWPYRTELFIQENTGSPLTDYQTQITITGSDLNASYNWTTNGFDLRILDEDDLTLLDFWVESWDQATETAVVWIKLNTLTSNQNRRLYIYYGNAFADELANAPFTFVEPGIKFHTKRVFTNPSSLTQAQTLFDDADDNITGYGCDFISNFTRIENSREFGSNQNFIAYSETYFEVKSDEEGTWGVRYGADFGGGGGLYVNGEILEEQWGDDLWWDNNWNAFNEVLEGTIYLTPGYHKLEVIGQEGGNDGGITVQFQRPGKNFVSYRTGSIDIVSRACPVSDPPTFSFGAQSTATCPAALAQYRLDRGPWSGTGNVRDQVGSFPGTMLGSVSNELDTQVCNGFNVEENESINIISGLQTGVDLDSDVGAIGSIGFWVRTEKKWDHKNISRTFMDASLYIDGSASDRYFFLETLGDGNLRFRFEDSNDGDFSITETAGTARNAGEWYHITLTWDFTADEFNLYEGDTLIASGTPDTNGAVSNLNTIHIGDNASLYNVASGNSSYASFDEVTIYNSVLSVSEIRGLMAKTRDCSIPVDVGSITISAPTTGINCLPSQVDITIFDSSGDQFFDYDDIVTLSTNVGHGDWTDTGSGYGILDNQTANDGSASYTMDINDSGSASLLLANSYPESTTFTVQTGGISQSATINFQPAGFVFSIIPNQVAALESGLISLQAVETDSVTGTCQSVLLNPTAVDLAVECVSPNECVGAISEINGSGVSSNDSAAGGPAFSYSSINLDFGDATSHSAPILFNYNEAGSLRLYARYTLKDEGGFNTVNTITGTSNDFVVVPAGFCIEPTETDWTCPTPSLTGTCTAFKQAGDAFDLSVTAKRANGSSTDYCNHGTTHNFTGSDVNLSHALISPTSINGGEASSFSLSSINLTAGVGTAAANFNEMGVFTLTAGGNTYLSATLPTNTSENIGRFFPKEFYIVSSTPAVFDDANTHIDTGTGFTYTGQIESDGTGSIFYDTQPEFVFEVRGANNQKLHNYLSPFNSIPVATVSATTNTLGNIVVPATTLSVTAGFNPGALSGPSASDQFTYLFNAADHFRYDRSQDSLRAPFYNDIQLTVSGFIEPVDGVDLAADTNISGSGGLIYYGRVRIENAYGPETEPVPQLFKTEYFNGTQFVLNALDDETEYDLAEINSIAVTDVGDASNNLAVGNSVISGLTADVGLFENGIFNTRWSVPISNRYGAYSFTYDVETWLMYDWNNSADGVNEDPEGIINFGQFRGNDRVIYWKEINY